MSKRLLLAFALAWTAAAASFDFGLAKGFPAPPVPATNPMSAAKVELGRHLFYDQRTSGNGTQSCATCHRQEFAFTDGRAHAEGSTGQIHPRSSMSLVNVAYLPLLTWAHPSMSTLEDQALVPMLGEHPVEMGLKGHEERFLSTLRKDRVYPLLFAAAFPGEPDAFTLANVTKAIAAFERTIISTRSPYDRYRWGGEASAISAAAKRGELLFFSGERAGCFQCHGGWNFSSPVQFAGEAPADRPARSNSTFFNTGTSSEHAPDRGLAEHTGNAQDTGKFRAPTLRNIAVTAPYMHDGSIATLEAVIDHYAAGGRFGHANKSPILRPLSLTAAERGDLVEFLKSLTDDALLHDPRFRDPWPAVTSPR